MWSALRLASKKIRTTENSWGAARDKARNMAYMREITEVQQHIQHHAVVPIATANIENFNIIGSDNLSKNKGEALVLVQVTHGATNNSLTHYSESDLNEKPPIISVIDPNISIFKNQAFEIIGLAIAFNKDEFNLIVENSDFMLLGGQDTVVIDKVNQFIKDKGTINTFIYDNSTKLNTYGIFKCEHINFFKDENSMLNYMHIFFNKLYDKNLNVLISSYNYRDNSGILRSGHLVKHINDSQVYLLYTEWDNINKKSIVKVEPWSSNVNLRYVTNIIDDKFKDSQNFNNNQVTTLVEPLYLNYNPIDKVNYIEGDFTENINPQDSWRNLGF